MSDTVGESGVKTPSTMSDSDDGSNIAPAIVQVKIERCCEDEDEGGAREPFKTEMEDPLALGPEQTEHFITVEVPQILKKTATCSIKHERVPAPGDTAGEEILKQYTLHAASTSYEKENPFSCDICKKPYAQRADLVQHELTVHKRVHTGVKPYSCDIYNKAFSERGHMVQHKLIHTGEKLFSCHLCNKSYARRPDLNQHKLTVHEKVRSYSCEICKKACLTRSHLTEHMLTHNGRKPHPCDVCGRRFKHMYTLTNHMWGHTGEKPYSCDICNKAFLHRGQMAKHMQIHTG